VKLKQFAETQKGQKQTTTSSRQYQLTLFDVQLWEKGAWKLDKKLEGETQHRWSEVVNTLARPIKNFCHQFVFFLKRYKRPRKIHCILQLNIVSGQICLIY